MGRRKAAVFPEPVWAQDMRSRPDMMMGRQSFCTGVGTLYPDLVMFSKRRGLRPAEEKDLMPPGGFSPVTLTGMFSNLEKLMPEVMALSNNLLSSISSFGT